MDTENQIDSPRPGDVSLVLPQPASPGTSPRRCSSLTRAGTPCKGYATRTGDTCVQHSPEGEAIRAKAVVASAQARKGKVEARKDAVERAKMGSRERLALELAEHQDAIMRVLVTESIENSDRRTLLALFDQAYGRPTETVAFEGDRPELMDEHALMAWINSPPSEPVLEHGTTPDPGDTNA